MSKTSPDASKHGELQQINATAAGVDVGSKHHWVAIPSDLDDEPVRTFETYTEDLHAMAAWLVRCGITTVALESTGVYWIPLWEVLEYHGLDVVLVDARKVKNVSGRKTDLLDCQWLQTLHSYGLLSGCFRPDAEIRVLRSYLRQRAMLIESRSHHVQHIQKALLEMNIQLMQVVSDVTGTSGMAIIRAIIAGERDRARLAELRDYRLKASSPQIIKALEGHWREEHLFALRQAVELYDVYQSKIDECDRLILAHIETLEPRADPGELPPTSKSKTSGLNEHMRRALFVALGVDLTRIDGLNVRSVEILISEIGTDMSRWANEKKFSAWLALAPNLQISGGKILYRRKNKHGNRASLILRMAAYGLQRSDSALGAYFRSMRARLGPGKAIKATAHRIAILVYRALRYGIEYADHGAAEYQRRQQDRQLRSLHQKAAKMGLALVPR